MKENKIKDTITRRALLVSGALAALAGVGGYLYRRPIGNFIRGLSRGGAVRPNIIVILIDTLRADRLGCYGNARGLTKNIDAFASESLRYHHTMAQSNWTLPSISSLFTSLFPHQHTAGLPIKKDVIPNPLPKEFPTLTESLADAGYHTMAVTGGAYVSRDAGMDRGFDEFYEISLKHDYSKGYIANDFPKQLERATGLVLDREGRRKPFFLFLHTYECHNPLIPPKVIVDALDPEYDGPPITGSIFVDMATVGKTNPNPAGLDRIKTLYDAAVFFVDDLLGLFFKALKEVGIYDDAYIVFVSDHGVEYYEHKGWRHGLMNLYEELARVPFIVKYPKSAKTGVITDRVARLIDLMPTVLVDFLGGKGPEIFMEGIPLSRPIPGGRSMSEAMMSESEMRLFALREGNTKFIVNNKNRVVTAFDLDRDPLEKKDIAGGFASEAIAEIAALGGRAEKAFLENLRKVKSGGEVKVGGENLELLKDLGYVE